MARVLVIHLTSAQLHPHGTVSRNLSESEPPATNSLTQISRKYQLSILYSVSTQGRSPLVGLDVAVWCYLQTIVFSPEK
jgi:hypothetical protein